MMIIYNISSKDHYNDAMEVIELSFCYGDITGMTSLLCYHKKQKIVPSCSVNKIKKILESSKFNQLIFRPLFILPQSGTEIH